MSNSSIVTEPAEWPKSPTAAAVRKARIKLGLTQKECAALIYRTITTWQKYEQGERVMDAAAWELWQSKVKQLKQSSDEQV